MERGGVVDGVGVGRRDDLRVRAADVGNYYHNHGCQFPDVRKKENEYKPTMTIGVTIL